MQYIFPLQAQKQNKIYEWLTDVHEAENGSESYVKARNTPRLTYEITAFAGKDECVAAYNLLYSGLSAQWGVPLWNEAQIIDHISGPVVYCATGNRSFEVDNYAILWKSSEEFLFSKIVGKSAIAIELEDSAVGFENCQVMPMQVGRIVGNPSRSFNGFDEQVSFRVEIDNPKILEPSEPDQFLNFDIYFPETGGLLEGDRAESSFQTRDDIADFGLGEVAHNNPWAHSKVVYPYNVLLEGFDEITDFENWLFRREGRYRPFWMPTWENDFRLTSSTSNALYVKEDWYLRTSSIRKTIGIETSSGWVACQISEVNDIGGGLLELVLSASISGTVLRVSWLGLRRLNSDRVEISYLGNNVAKVALSCLEIDPNGDTDGIVLTEQGLDFALENDQLIAVEEATSEQQAASNSKKISQFAESTFEDSEESYLAVAGDGGNAKVKLTEFVGRTKSALQTMLGALKMPFLTLYSSMGGSLPSGAEEGSLWYNGDVNEPVYFDGLNVKRFGRPHLHAGIVGDFPTLTSLSGGQVLCGACRVALYNNSDNIGTLTEFDVPETTVQLTDKASELVIISYNSGSPEYQVINAWALGDYNLSDTIVIEKKYYTFGDIHTTDFAYRTNDLPSILALRIAQTMPYARVGGIGLEPSSSGLTLLVSAAEMWVSRRLSVLAYSSATDSLEKIYTDASGIVQSVSVTEFDTTNYNPSGSGLVALNNNYWTAAWIYRTIGEDKECYIVVHNEQYNSRDNARTNAKTRIIDEPVLNEHSILIGRAIFQKGSSTVEIDSAWATVFAGGNTSDHESLTGLLGGDATNGHWHLTLAQFTAYITNFGASVRSTLLTGLSLATSSDITSADTVLTALGKLGARINSILSSLNNYVTTNTTQTISGLKTFSVGLKSDRAATSLNSFEVGVSGNAYNSFEIRANGSHFWGDGLSPLDTALYRSSTDTLTTPDNLKALSFDKFGGSDGTKLTGNVQTQLNGKQATLTFDTTPTSGSTNPVTSGGVYTEVNKRAYTPIFEYGDYELPPTAPIGLKICVVGANNVFDYGYTRTVTVASGYSNYIVIAGGSPGRYTSATVAVYRCRWFTKIAETIWLEEGNGMT